MKKLEKAQMGKIVKSGIKTATNFAGKNKDLKTLLKVNAALGTGAAGWMAVDNNAKKKKLGVYGLDSLANKKQMGGPQQPSGKLPSAKELNQKATPIGKKGVPPDYSIFEKMYEKRKAAEVASPKYKIENYKPYKPIVAKKGGVIKTKKK